MALPNVTGTGNLTADPELRYTQSGTAVTNINVAFNSRRKDQNGQWVDGDTTFLRATVWEAEGENVAADFSKGQKVLVTGVLKQRDFEDREGNKRTVFEIDRANVARPVARFSDNNGGGNQGVNRTNQGGGNQGGGDPFGGDDDSQPPF